MMRVRDLYVDKDKLKEVEIKGHIRNIRSQKEFGFIDVNDGTCFETVQVVFESNLENFVDISKFRVGSAIGVKGELILTPKGKQAFEIKATEVTLIADSPEDYPIQPKRHSKEFLREKAHLRSRTNLFSAVFRLRSVAAHAIHCFFQEKDFIYCHSPIITANDGEGAGEMFRVTTMDPAVIAKHNRGTVNKDGSINYKKDFFGKKVGLTVTGQLEGETLSQSMRASYTFGPTFRAENSNTTRHASEFWMIEPDVAFADLNDNMQLAEDLVKYVIKYCYDRCPSEMKFFNQFVEKGLKEKLEKVLNCEKFPRVKHFDAIEILKASGIEFDNAPIQGEDLSTEHEKFLTEHFDGPVFVTDWPKDIKAFYMRMNEDGKTVAAMDLLVPGSGELMGGSEREERLENLVKRMEEMDVPREDLEWYLDLRKYGGVITSGFGVGFERLLMYLTGMENIRDVVPFPRTPKNCDF